ncbi:hypothetical protein [Deinococcus sp.]|uniref:hypothetical protein n=1 Tax=Deinococcus sp. TaxID=47478 RepID=UPI003C7E60D5
MNHEELLRYAGQRNGSICVDLRFDPETCTQRDTSIYFFRGQWSVGLRYLTYEPGVSLEDSSFTQAYLTGDYPSLDEVIEHLKVFLSLKFETWKNFTKTGLLLDLTPTEKASYEAINWQYWQPEHLLVPSGTTLEIMRPEEWRGQVTLLPVTA